MMARYLLLWEMNRNLVPIDAKERSTGWGTLLAMVKKDLAKGVMKDWGAFPGENRGYLIAEGSQLDVLKMTQQFTPYVNFKIHPVSAVGEIETLLEHMAG
jgi:hypothetical protein